MSESYELWKGKDLSGLFKDIYNNQRETQAKITLLIDMLRPLINSAGDAAVIVPLIADYLDVSVKNDSHLVRLSAVVQKLVIAEKIAQSGGAGGILTEEEKRRLLEDVNEEIKQIQKSESDTTKQLTSAETQTKQLTAPDTEEEESDVV